MNYIVLKEKVDKDGFHYWIIENHTGKGFYNIVLCTPQDLLERLLEW